MGSGLSEMSSSWSSSSPSRSSREISAMVSVGERSRSHYFLWEADRCEENSWTRLGHSKDPLFFFFFSFFPFSTGCSSDQRQTSGLMTDLLSGNNSSKGGTGPTFYRQQGAVSPAARTHSLVFFIYIYLFIFSRINWNSFGLVLVSVPVYLPFFLADSWLPVLLNIKANKRNHKNTVSC